MKTVKELLKEYDISKEYPLFIINTRNNTNMSVTWRYLEGGWNEVLNATVIDFGRDPDTDELVIEIES